MTQPVPQARPVAEIAEVPRFTHQARYALEMYHSYPIPVRTSRGVELAFLLGGQNANPRVGLSYGVPTRLAYFDLGSGAEQEVRTVTPAEFGQSMPTNGSLGLLPPLTVEQATDLPRVKQQLYAAYDRLLPAFAARRNELTVSERNAARTAREILPRLEEVPLKPYYAAVGREFFGWIASVA